MKQRCYNPHTNVYKYYGGRGITVCDEWLKSYHAFRDWAFANGYREDLSIDRIDNDKGYSPENCRWVSVNEQRRNRRNSHWITINGETKRITDWSNETGISIQTFYKRLKRGITGEKLISKKPVIGAARKPDHWITINGETKALREWAEEKGLNKGTVQWRWQQGLRGEDLFVPVKRKHIISE